MTNGVKIGLLAVIAALLGVIGWKLLAGTGTDAQPLSKEQVQTIQPGTPDANGNYDPATQARIDQAANQTGKPAPNTFYETDKNGQPNYQKPLPMDAASKKAQDQPGSASAGRTKTSMTFETLEHDFGTIKEGDKVEYSFKFKNTGNEPLIIEDAKGSCGCTVPVWPKDPIAPGKSEVIKISFDSSGKPNAQTKTVTITANTDPVQSRLTIKANVLPKDPNAAPKTAAGH